MDDKPLTEIEVRRFLTKTSFVFGLTIGLLIGVILTWRSFQ